ncbi:hypothetical protein SAMN02910456_01061 [Ruminococcaceae bacterium YRB3002]|nr:hypothetical protein SAMN02910456_01061 [Ruminococcaceae bacterium YRB3002]
MLYKEYPQHDMNVVFEMMEKVLKVGDCHEHAMDEMDFLNHLMASLPAEAVEWGMQFLHGNRDLPKSCDEIMPLYIRFLSLVEYCEKIEFLREIPENMTHEDIMRRSEIMESLEKHENMFRKPLMGFTMKNGEPAAVEQDADGNDAEEESSLHLLNYNAAVFVCEDVLATSLFYETKLGFKAVHLDDESMPHIKLTRDNVAIVLASGSLKPMREVCGVSYDMYLYVSEPLLFYNEVKGAGVKIIEDLTAAADSVNLKVNRQFVFEDCDGRHVCVSQEPL